MITNYPALRQLDICLEIWLYPLRLMAIMGSVQAVVALTFERFSAITRRVWERGGEGGDGLNHRSQLLQVLDLHGTTSLQVFSPRHHFYSHLRSGIQCSEIFRTYLSLRAEYFRIKTRTAQFIIQNLSNLPSSLPPPTQSEINKPTQYWSCCFVILTILGLSFSELSIKFNVNVCCYKVSTCWITPSPLRLSLVYSSTMLVSGSLLNTIIPIIALLYLNSRILTTIKARERMLRHLTSRQVNIEKQGRTDWRNLTKERDLSVARVLVWSVSVFIICHSPKFLLSIIELVVLGCYETQGTEIFLGENLISEKLLVMTNVQISWWLAMIPWSYCLHLSQTWWLL